jgi:hypothetical protein
MVTELDQRFKQESINVITAMVNPLNLEIAKDQQKLLSETFAVFLDLRLLRSDDSVPKGSTSSVTLIKEWLCWLKLCDRSRTFNLFTMVIQDFTAVPVTSCSCERAISELSHVKSKLRSTMTQDLLQNLMLLYVEQDLAASVNVDTVTDEFKTMVPFEDGSFYKGTLPRYSLYFLFTAIICDHYSCTPKKGNNIFL